MESKPRQDEGDRKDTREERGSGESLGSEDDDALDQLTRPKRPIGVPKRGGTGIGRDLDH